MRLKFGTCSKENIFNKDQPFRVLFWPFWSGHIPPGHPNPFNWSPNSYMALRLVKAPIWTWHFIYFMKAVTKTLPPHPKRTQSLMAGEASFWASIAASFLSSLWGFRQHVSPRGWGTWERGQGTGPGSREEEGHDGPGGEGEERGWGLLHGLHKGKGEETAVD